MAVTKVPQPLISLKYTNAEGNTVTTDEDGKATYKDYKIVAAPSGLLKFVIYSDYYECSSYEPWYFNIKNDLANVVIEGKEELKNEDLDFNSRTIDIEKSFDVTLKFYNSLGEPYAAQEVNVDLAPVQIPPSSYQVIVQVGDSMIAMEEEFISLEYLEEKTDRLGRLTIRLRIKNKMYGLWGISFTAGSALTLPYLFKTNFPVAEVRVIQPISYKSPENGPAEIGTGDIFTVTPRIKVVDAQNNPIEGVTVTALLAEGSGCKNGTPTAMVDDYAYGCSSYDKMGIYVALPFFAGQKFDTTNDKGEASFEYFTLMDSIAYNCVRFVFIVGEPGFMVKSAPTDEICVRNYYQYKLEPGTSLSVTDGQAFGKQPVVTIRRPKWAFSDFAMIIVSGMIRYMDGSRKSNREAASSQVLANYVCVFFGKECINGGCKQLKVIKKGPPATLQATFESLTWTKPTVSSTFQLEFSTPLNEEGASLSPTIEVVSSPNNLAVFFLVNNKIKVPLATAY